MSGAATGIVQSREDRNRSPLALLIHALNQPLTGLQCSIELALAGRRPAEYYIRTLREGLDLLSRMRVLVEGLRELSEYQSLVRERVELRLDELIEQVAGELRPIADAKKVTLQVSTPERLLTFGCRSHLLSLLFRSVDAVLSLADQRSELKIEGSKTRDSMFFTISWSGSALPGHSPISAPAVSLIIAEAEWRQLGAGWKLMSDEERQRCEIRWPAVAFSAVEGTKES
ncbi:MAG TPA: hypothetical protein VGS27_15255 [Candidatus Sulfotelmatobacter sp.]|nr:hypothetical protein [Candidatus Sulfotelmatobacter sp.]